jgi:hypothetical protein
MDDMRGLTALAFAYGLVIGGALAELFGDFLLLVTGGIALGSFGGAAYGWRACGRGDPWQERGARRAQAAANGALVGGVFGLCAAVIDALAGG